MPLKQKVGISVWLLVFLLSFFLESLPHFLFVLALGLPLICMGFGPTIYQKIKLPKKYWFIPLCTSLSFSFILIDLKEIFYFQSNWESWIMAILFPILILLFRVKECFQTIKVSSILEPIKTTESFKRFFQSLWLLVGEEALFRMLFYNVISSTYFIGINALLFIYYHFFNRYSFRMYKVKDYLFQGVLAIHLGVLYLYTNSLIFCILSHLIYNSFYFIGIIINTNFSKKFLKGVKNGKSIVE